MDIELCREQLGFQTCLDCHDDFTLSMMRSKRANMAWDANIRDFGKL